MEFTYENQGINTFLVWKMGKEDVLDELIKGMVENNEMKGLLPLTFSQNNLDRYIKYNISSKVTLKQYLSGMVNRQSFVDAMLSLVNAILELDDYMIEKEKLLLDMEHIYINVGTAQVGLVVLPIEKVENPTDLASFLRNVMFHIQFNPNENGNYIAVILNYLNSGNPFSITEFKKLLEEQGGAQSPAGHSGKLTAAAKAEPKMSTMAGGQNVGRPQQVSQSGAGAANFGAPQNGAPQNGNGAANFGAPQNGNGAANFGAPQNGNGAANFGALQGNNGAMNFGAPQSSNGAMNFGAPQNGTMTAGFGAPQSAPKKKEKFSLFGKKNKKQEQQPAQAKAQQPKKNKKDKKKGKNQTPAQPAFQGGFAIPGQQSQNFAVPQGGNGTVNAGTPQGGNGAANFGTPQGGNGAANFGTPQNNNGATNFGAPQNNNGATNFGAPKQPVMQEVKMNFGETTVLSQATAAETTVLTANSAGAELKPYILRKKNNQKAFIEKNEFRIGKEANYVDFCIADNSAVSRSHADIITRNGAYFIRDNNSLNHTFLDGRQLQGGVEVQLENGVKFKLADEDFEFWLY